MRFALRFASCVVFMLCLMIVSVLSLSPVTEEGADV
jgi:hypothetical protein